MISRRHFLSIAAAIIVVPELIVPKRTFFLPPKGGWYSPDTWQSVVSRYRYVVMERLPLGISLSAEGVLSGMPLAPGSYVARIEAIEGVFHDTWGDLRDI